MTTQGSAFHNLKHTFTIDASYNAEEECVGIGIVLQVTDKPWRRGEILEMIEETHRGKGLAKEMEKFSVFRALQIATERGYRRVKIRSDYNYMRTRLKKDCRSGDGLERDDLTGQVLRLAKRLVEVRFAYCPRRKNQMAHRLARRAARINVRTRRSNYSFPPKTGTAGMPALQDNRSPLHEDSR